MPACALAVDDAPRIGINLESDDTPLKPGSHGLTTLAPRIINLMLASNESSHVALDTKNGATIVRVLTGFASSFDRNMPAETRQKLYEVGYSEKSFTCVSWGKPLTMSNAFVQAYCEEAYTLISWDWLADSGISPPGQNMAALRAELRAIIG